MRAVQHSQVLEKANETKEEEVFCFFSFFLTVKNGQIQIQKKSTTLCDSDTTEQKKSLYDIFASYGHNTMGKKNTN